MPSTNQPSATPAEHADEVLEVLRRLTSVAEATMTVIGAVLAEFDLTTSSAGLLWALDPKAEPPTMRSLARQLRCDPSTVSLMADKLDTRGLLERRPHPTDGRMRTLVLTERGRAVWETFSRRLVDSSPLAALDADQLRTLGTLLAAVDRSDAY